MVRSLSQSEGHWYQSAGSPPLSERPVVLELDNVSLDIPVFTTETVLWASLLLRHWRPPESQSRGAVITALQGVTLNVHRGGRVALIGHNGAEMSFLRLVSGIYKHLRVVKAHVPVPMIHKGL